MGYTDATSSYTEENEPALDMRARKPRHNYGLHILLFVLTFLSVAYTSLEFVVTEPIKSYTDLLQGIPFALLLMFFLSAHEFGHYFAARAHGVDATLPYYIPMPFFMFGTMGAVIRTRSIIPSRRALFDIGVAGPLAGFVVALSYLVVGMITMPGIESLYHIHPQYELLDSIPSGGIHFGSFLLFDILKAIFIEPGRFFPPMNEIYHYPFLAVGWFGMFVTALNMIPVGQLDGGHILYAMFGEKQVVVSRWFFRFLIFAGLGWVASVLLDAVRTYDADPVYQFLQGLYGPVLEWIDAHASWWLTGWPGWLLWGVIIKILIRIEHPPTPLDEPIGRNRMIIGWIALAILVLTFSYTGIFDRPLNPVQEQMLEPKTEQGTVV